MQRNTVTMTALAFFALAFARVAAQQSPAQGANNSYPTSMAPIDQYLMDRDAEIAMARSAAPPSVAKDATVMVFGRDGDETAIKGTNGLVCNVDRSWMDRFEKAESFGTLGGAVRSATTRRRPRRCCRSFGFGQNWHCLENRKTK